MLAPYVGTHVGYVLAPAGSVNLSQHTDWIFFYKQRKDIQSNFRLAHSKQAEVTSHQLYCYHDGIRIISEKYWINSLIKLRI